MLNSAMASCSMFCAPRMLSAAAALLRQNFPNYLLTWMTVMDSLREASARATVLSSGVMDSGLLGAEFGERTGSIILTFRVIDSLGMGAVILSVSVLSMKRVRDGQNV